jgi:putative restriction endonuclease
MGSNSRDRDLALRLAAFDWLSEQTDIHGDVLPRDLLTQGFHFEGERVPLLAPQGIFRPRVAELPLTITTSPNSPYDDAFSDDGYLHYRYRGTDPDHRDNAGLRRLMHAGRPLIYFHGIVPGRYLTVCRSTSSVMTLPG